MLVVKVLALFINGFSLDSWKTPQIFSLINPSNLCYYGGIVISANLCLLAIVVDKNKSNSTGSTYFLCMFVVIGFIMSDMVGDGLQILLFEIIFICSCFIIFWGSIATFFIGLGCGGAYYILFQPVRWLVNSIVSSITIPYIALPTPSIALPYRSISGLTTRML